MAGQTLKILASVAVIGGAVTYLFVDTLQADPEAFTYFRPADVVIAQPNDYYDKRIRMGGYVEKGSIFQKKGTLEWQFDVRPIDGRITHKEAEGKTITVKYTGVVPDTFKDDAEVIVTGELGRNGTFEAKELLAKCPSKYEAEAKNKGKY